MPPTAPPPAPPSHDSREGAMDDTDPADVARASTAAGSPQSDTLGTLGSGGVGGPSVGTPAPSQGDTAPAGVSITVELLRDVARLRDGGAITADERAALKGAVSRAHHFPLAALQLFHETGDRDDYVDSLVTFARVQVADAEAAAAAAASADPRDSVAASPSTLPTRYGSVHSIDVAAASGAGEVIFAGAVPHRTRSDPVLTRFEGRYRDGAVPSPDRGVQMTDVEEAGLTTTPIEAHGSGSTSTFGYRDRDRDAARRSLLP